MATEIFGDMWVPIRTGVADDGQAGGADEGLVQVGRRSGGMCNRHIPSFYGGTQAAHLLLHTNWCHNAAARQPYRAVYACCASGGVDSPSTPAASARSAAWRIMAFCRACREHSRNARLTMTAAARTCKRRSVRAGYSHSKILATSVGGSWTPPAGFYASMPGELRREYVLHTAGAR